MDWRNGRLRTSLPQLRGRLADASQMAARAEDTEDVFRFLDLPPELRNRVYDFIFEDLAPDIIDIFAAKAAAPSPAITAVSTQLRNETIELFHEASRIFWTKHQLSLEIGTEILESECREQLMARCELLRLPAPQQIHLRVSNGDAETMRFLKMHVIGDDSSEKFKTRWTDRLNGGSGRDMDWARIGQGIEGAGAAGLDVFRCVRTFCAAVAGSERTLRWGLGRRL